MTTRGFNYSYAWKNKVAAVSLKEHYYQLYQIFFFFYPFQIANMIRFLVDSYNMPVPAILEIPSKDHPYDPTQDSVLSRVRYLFATESVASGRRWRAMCDRGWISVVLWSIFLYNYLVMCWRINVLTISEKPRALQCLDAYIKHIIYCFNAMIMCNLHDRLCLGE